VPEPGGAGEPVDDAARSLDRWWSRPATSRSCASQCGCAARSEDNLTYHEATLRQILEEQGYESEEHQRRLGGDLRRAGELQLHWRRHQLRGGLCNVCLAYLSVPVMSFSIPKAGDYIDNSTAQ